MTGTFYCQIRRCTSTLNISGLNPISSQLKVVVLSSWVPVQRTCHRVEDLQSKNVCDILMNSATFILLATIPGLNSFVDIAPWKIKHVSQHCGLESPTSLSMAHYILTELSISRRQEHIWHGGSWTTPGSVPIWMCRLRPWVHMSKQLIWGEEGLTCPWKWGERQMLWLCKET